MCAAAAQPALNLREAINAVMLHHDGGDGEMRGDLYDACAETVRAAFWDGCLSKRAILDLRIAGFSFTYEAAEQWPDPIVAQPPHPKRRRKNSPKKPVNRVLDFTDM